MKDIKELAPRIAYETDVAMVDLKVDQMAARDLWNIAFATRLIAAYTEGQEPVAWIAVGGATDLKGGVYRKLFWQQSNARNGWAREWKPLYSAPPEPTPNLYREIYEVWAGSEGIPMPRTAPEAYLLGLLEQMVDIAKTGMNMTEPAPQDSLKESSSPEHTSSTASDSRPACAAPSSEEVREILARLNAVGNTSLEYAAADLIERLAARVPDGCVVVPKSALAWLFGEEGEFECPPDKYFRGKAPAYWWRSKFRELIAAGEAK